MKKTGWIGVDLDGCLAKYDGWQNSSTIGEPVPLMLERVKGWLAEGKDVRIFTARVGPQKDVNETIRARDAIEKWCVEHLSAVLPVTATKDFAMQALWDDRCVQVIPNTGVTYEDLASKAFAVVNAIRAANGEEVEKLSGELAAMLE